MALLDNPDIRIQIIVERPGFRDAIQMTAAEYAAAKDSDIEAMKDERYQAYLAHVEEQRKVVAQPPRKEDMASELVYIKERVVDLKTRASDADLKALLSQISEEAKVSEEQAAAEAALATKK